MKTFVNVGWSHEYKLTQALLLFGKADYNFYPSHQPFVTVHDVAHEDGTARLGAGHLLTPEMLRRLLSEIGQSSAIEILPEQVIARARGVTVWWAPAKCRRMYFHTHNQDASLHQLNAKEYPHPPLLFRASATNLWIRALGRNERPTSGSKLYVAPYWNCYDTGVVCTGSMKIPESQSPSVISEWEDSFFRSAFTHAAGVTRHTRHPGGVLAMWKSLQGKRRFPPDYLFPIQQTVEEFVACDDNKYQNQRQ
jgi:PRTRC genetic system protein B